MEWLTKYKGVFMYKLQKLRRFFGWMGCVGLLTMLFPLQAYDVAYRDAVANEALQAYSPIDTQKEPEEKFVEPGFMLNLKKLFKPYESKFTAPPERMILENAFIQIPKESMSTDQNVIDVTSIKELDVIRGSSRAYDSLINRLTGVDEESFLSTVMGRKVFIDTITTPVDEIARVKKNQRVIEVLVKNKPLREKCFDLLQKMKKAEPYFFAMYSKDGLSEAEKTLYPGPMLNFLGLGEVPAAITFADRLFEALPVIDVALSAAYGAMLGVEKREKRGPTPRDASLLEAARASLLSTGETEIVIHPKRAAAGAAGASLLFSPLTAMQAGMVKGFIDGVKSLQERMIHAATFVRSAQELLKLLSLNKDIEQVLPNLNEEIAYLEGQNASKKFRYLNKLLRKSTFNEGAPSALSSPGNILVAYKYLADKTIRSEYASLMNRIGELDVFVALAKKIDAHKDMDAQFCFASFKTDKDKPMIEAVNFWNPFIDPKIVVPNTVSLNTGAERNIILTGANTGGKSTIMKALMISILMAQTYGVAPAKSLTFTPFTKLMTYLNIVDDTGAGISSFKAEVKRASELLNTLKALPENQFAFVTIDEIFKGTSPKNAEKLSYDFMKKMSEFKNVIFVNATHYPKLTELEQETGSVDKNYHTGVVTDEEGRVIKYTYQLVPGPTTVSSALQVTEEEGIEF